MEYSHHSLILLAGFAVAGLALLAAIAVGPYGRRGVRTTLALVSLAAFLGSAFWLFTYLGLIEQRRGIETRLKELRAQALSTGSSLACLERTGDAVEAACERTIFAAPETLAAANVYVAARLDLLIAAARYTGPRTPQFDDDVAALERALRQDPFGLTANALVVHEGCTAQRCDAIAAFHDPTRPWENIRKQAFQANVARHAAAWRTTPGAAPAPAAPGIVAPTGTETRAPIPEKYTLPSSSSIPPVSIMSDEPPRSAPAPAEPPAQAQSEPPPPTQTKPAARRETKRPSGPLPISPKQ